MITGNCALIELTNDNVHTYHLTGSRFFGDAGPSSDWDYFVKEDPHIENFLARSGWCQEFDGSYNDPVLVSCWRKDNVHVQVVEDVDLKLKVQDFIKEKNLLSKMTHGIRTRSERRAIHRIVWMVALQTYKYAQAEIGRMSPIHPDDYKYHSLGKFNYVTIEMVQAAHSEEEVKSLVKWMVGQTFPMTDDTNFPIYGGDYSRWLRQVMLADMDPVEQNND